MVGFCSRGGGEIKSVRAREREREREQESDGRRRIIGRVRDEPRHE
jgi:hypothetical protein